VNVKSYSLVRDLSHGGSANLHAGSDEIASAVRIFHQALELAFTDLDYADKLELGTIEPAQRHGWRALAGKYFRGLLEWVSNNHETVLCGTFLLRGHRLLRLG